MPRLLPPSQDLQPQSDSRSRQIIYIPIVPSCFNVHHHRQRASRGESARVGDDLRHEANGSSSGSAGDEQQQRSRDLAVQGFFGDSVSERVEVDALQHKHSGDVDDGCC